MVALLFRTIECLRRKSHLRLTELKIRPDRILNYGVVRRLTQFEGGRLGIKIFVRNVDTSRKHADSRKNADTGTEGYGQEVVRTGESYADKHAALALTHIYYVECCI